MTTHDKMPHHYIKMQDVVDLCNFVFPIMKDTGEITRFCTIRSIMTFPNEKVGEMNAKKDKKNHHRNGV